MRFLSMVVEVRRVMAGAMLMSVLLLAGCGTSSPSGNTVTATPAFNPGGGTYNKSQTVTITDSTAGAVLYCTTDGTAPTASSPVCSQPTTVYKSEFLQAIAVAPGMSASGVAAAGYTIDLSAAATPTFTPGGGTYTSAQTVAIASATAGANIFYTVDGTTPTASSALYTGPITVSKTETVSAIAIASGFNNSGVAVAAYTINSVAATPVFSPAGGTYTTTQPVTISDATAGAQIYYTTNGSAPSATNGTLYSGAIPVTSTTTIQAIAVASGFTNSAVATAAYTINSTPAAMPVFSPAAGTYTTTQPVTISDATAGAQIYYTTNGSAPSATNGTLYSGAISVASTTTVQAVAVAPGFANSAVATAAYTINTTPAATPVFSPAAGTYTTTQSVTISDSTAGAQIYYTSDGSAPSATNGTLYSGAISVAATKTVKAIAVASGFANSAVATAAYTINAAPAATPTFSVAAGTYSSAQSVTISDSTPGATIYYTLDGSNPTTSSFLYGGPVNVTATETLKAIAAATGFSNSAVATAAYTITAPSTATPTFSLAGGTYVSNQTVTISDSTAGAVIYYTVDGTLPTTSSPAYGGAAITVSSPTTISAIAVAPGNSASAVASATYNVMIGNSSLTGSVMSGPVPVKGAVVQLYTAGQSGYGSAGSALIPISITTDTNGAFSFTYNCPVAPDDQVYLIASGGDSGSGVNSSLAMMSALGSCISLGTSASVMVNEATTVASVYSLAQFAVPQTSGVGIVVGSSSTNAIGLTNAMKTVPNLVSLGSGTVNTITPSYQGAGVVPGDTLNSSYVPQARIDTLANMLNGCVHSNGSGGNCSALFTAATPPSVAAPLDTLQAALNIAQHPGTNAGGLYGVASQSGPFLPVLSSAPSDWTLALTFEGAGMGVPPGTDPGFSATPTALAIDATGNIWLSSTNQCNNGSTTVDAVFEFDNQGNGISPASTAANSYCGGYQPRANGGAVLSGGSPGFTNGLAVDLNGNIWVATATGTPTGVMAELASDGTVKLASASNYGASKCSVAGDVLVDGFNNLWFDCSANSSGAIGETSSVDGTPITSQNLDGTQPLVSLTGGGGGIALDPTGSLWAVASAAQATDFTHLYQFNTGATPPTVTNDFQTSGKTFTYSVAADGAGNVFSVSDTPGTINRLVASTSALSSLPYPLPSSTVGVERLAIDGAGNLWGAAFAGDPFNTGQAFIPSYLVEMTSTGTLLSPQGSNVYGYTGTGGGGETQPILANYGFFTNFAGMAVDNSGNLWVANNQVIFTSAFVGTPTQQLVKFIGIAAPVSTPSAAALQNGTLGARP